MKKKLKVDQNIQPPLEKVTEHFSTQKSEELDQSFDLEKYFQHSCHAGKIDVLRKECLKFENQMLQQVSLFKEERFNLENSKYQNNGEKQLIKKMMKFEMINVADRVENIESILKNQCTEQMLLIKMMIQKYDDVQKQ